MLSKMILKLLVVAAAFAATVWYSVAYQPQESQRMALTQFDDNAQATKELISYNAVTNYVYLFPTVVGLAVFLPEIIGIGKKAKDTLSA